MTKRVPEIRFEGFRDDWEQRKLGDSVLFLNGRAYKQQELLEKGKYRVLRVGNFNTNDQWYYSDLELEENKYADKGDLLYLWATNFGPRIWKEERVIYHYHIWKLEIIDELVDKYYLYTWLEKDKERIKQTTNGTTMVHVTKGGIEERKFQSPKKISEQKKIGVFFNQLEATITLHQRKLEQLQSMKNGFLQKMFPKDGEKEPEIRFQGFTDDWEQRKLGELTEVFKSGMNIQAENIYETGDFPVYGGNGIRGYTHTFNHDGEFALVGRQGALSGNMNYSIGKAYFTEHAVAVKANEVNDTKFLFYLMSKLKLGRWVTQSAQPGLAVGTIVEIKSLVPNKDEQEKISRFLTNLDDTIALHQRELELLKQTKKAFLQKMFV